MMPGVVIARSIVVWLLVRVVIDVLGDIVGDLCLCQIVSRCQGQRSKTVPMEHARNAIYTISITTLL